MCRQEGHKALLQCCAPGNVVLEPEPAGPRHKLPRHKGVLARSRPVPKRLGKLSERERPLQRPRLLRQCAPHKRQAPRALCCPSAACPASLSSGPGEEPAAAVERVQPIRHCQASCPVPPQLPHQPAAQLLREAVLDVCAPRGSAATRRDQRCANRSEPCCVPAAPDTPPLRHAVQEGCPHAAICVCKAAVHKHARLHTGQLSRAAQRHTVRTPAHSRVFVLCCPLAHAPQQPRAGLQHAGPRSPRAQQQQPQHTKALAPRAPHAQHPFQALAQRPPRLFAQALLLAMVVAVQQQQQRRRSNAQCPHGLCAHSPVSVAQTAPSNRLAHSRSCCCLALVPAAQLWVSQRLAHPSPGKALCGRGVVLEAGNLQQPPHNAFPHARCRLCARLPRSTAARSTHTPEEPCEHLLAHTPRPPLPVLCCHQRRDQVLEVQPQVGQPLLCVFIPGSSAVRLFDVCAQPLFSVLVCPFVPVATVAVAEVAQQPVEAFVHLFFLLLLFSFSFSSLKKKSRCCFYCYCVS